ncbi:ferritin-like domain-containing protein [Jidongwangia harbinensis]|uniref:ferritin-like domain-containing protein n=1 Tax=Jidongwangia harbinensis TaxID=2878561 RepID=UPI001CD97841|nr:ferritin-like domain-containing protein [Jidongwangia harbinensis]MCA2215216.1 ferritin-like domain-containing protein [Jidongwangia harbinensis]
MSAELAAALAAEEAAIYAYGLIGVHLDGAGARAEARTAEAGHRNRRDVLVARLDELRASAAPAPAGYQLPFEVTDHGSALKLAIEVEQGVAAAWRAALPATADDDRATAVDALAGAAVRATRWRRLAGVSPVTVPFPGRP